MIVFNPLLARFIPTGAASSTRVGGRRTGGVSKFGEKLITGMVKNGYTQDFAEKTFKQLEGFGSYGFPESHAASFALIAYASSWMKCWHPDVFCAALLNAQPMGFYAPAQIVRDARDHGVEVRPLGVNASRWGLHAGAYARRKSLRRPARAAHGQGSRQYRCCHHRWRAGGSAVRLG
jgi:error-prone DNA polymerase